MGTDLIKGVNSKNEPEFFKVPGVDDSFSGSTPIPDGQSLTSDITYIEGYQHLVSELEADQNCTIQYQWFADKDGVQSLGVVNSNYITGAGVQLIWETVAGPFLRLVISNSSGADMARFWHRIRLTNSPLVSSDIDTIQSQLVNIQTEIDAEALASRTNETSEHTTTRATIVSEGDQTQAALADVNSELDSQTTALGSIQTEINDEHTATRSTITTKSDEEQAKLDTIESSLTAIQTEVNDEHTATRSTITTKSDEEQAKLTAIEADIEANTSQLTNINTELDAQTALLQGALTTTPCTVLPDWLTAQSSLYT